MKKHPILLVLTLLLTGFLTNRGVAYAELPAECRAQGIGGFLLPHVICSSVAWTSGGECPSNQDCIDNTGHDCMNIGGKCYNSGGARVLCCACQVDM